MFLFWVGKCVEPNQVGEFHWLCLIESCLSQTKPRAGKQKGEA